MFGELVLGGAQLGLNYGITKKHNYFCEKNSEKILQSAKSLGISMVDIAFEYGDIFHLINKINPGLDIISKLKIFDKEYPDLFLNYHNKIKSLRYMLIHDADLFDGSQEAIVRVEKFINFCDKKNLNWGISLYEFDTLKKLIFHGFKPFLVQYPFNLLYAKDEIGDFCSTLGIQAQIRSVFLQGLLTVEQRKDLPKEFFDNESLLNWQRWLKTKKIKPLAACLRGDRVASKLKVIGVQNSYQLEAIVKCLAGRIIDTSDLKTTNDTNLLDPRKWI